MRDTGIRRGGLGSSLLHDGMLRGQAARGWPWQACMVSRRIRHSQPVAAMAGEDALLENCMSLDSYGSSFSASAIWTRQQGVEPEPQYRTRSEDAMAGAVTRGRC